MDEFPSAPPTESRRSRARVAWHMGLVFTIVLGAAAGMYFWYSLQNPCDAVVVKNTSALLVSQLRRYDHAYQFATSAAPGAVDRPVLTLQQILTYVEQIDVPACMRSAKQELVAYMQSVVSALQAYGAQQSEATVRDWLRQSDAHYDNFYSKLDAVNRCAPFCLP